MLQGVTKPRRILMTLDAVGGVWRYALDLCKALAGHELQFVLAGLGLQPSEAQRREISDLPNVHLVWLAEPLDWMAENESDLDLLPARLSAFVEQFDIDLLHLNLPSQAYRLSISRPVVAVSHSCVVTWWQAVKGTPLPDEWRWQKARNRGGFDAADIVLSPSRSHAELLTHCYGAIERLQVAPNATGEALAGLPDKEPFVFAAGRWWDEGKNGMMLDEAARACDWPVLMAGACSNAQGQAVTLTHAEQLGELPHHEAAEIMARAGIVASPSLYEPFGLVALEAARAGSALVLADIPTYRELWDGAALFADPRDPASFADAINRLAADADLRAELGERAAHRAERFTLRAQADALLDAYRTAARHRAARQQASAA